MKTIILARVSTQEQKEAGKKLEFTMRKPFDTVLELATCPTGLRGII